MDINDLGKKAEEQARKIAESEQVRSAVDAAKAGAAKAGEAIHDFTQSDNYKEAKQSADDGLRHAAYAMGKAYQQAADSQAADKVAKAFHTGAQRFASFASALGDEARRGAEDARRKADDSPAEPRAIEGDIVDGPSDERGHAGR